MGAAAPRVGALARLTRAPLFATRQTRAGGRGYSCPMKQQGQLSVRLTEKGRLQAIERIMEARFMIGAFEQIRKRDATSWAAKGNAMGRGIYSQALRERERLVEASNAQLCAELAELA